MASDDGQSFSQGTWVAAGAAPAGTALAGLDALDLAGRPGGGRGRLALRLWNAFWPKVLAIALVLGIWELVTLSGYKKEIFPATGPTLVNLWDQAKTGTLWQALGNTLESAVIGFAVACSARWCPGSTCSGRRSAP
jgi:NitT/TauT family transport system permease protein